MEAVITDIFFITDTQKNKRIKMRGKYSGNEPGYFFCYQYFADCRASPGTTLFIMSALF